MSALVKLETGEAMEWFRTMPATQRLRSLAPDFARADTLRGEGLECRHAGYREGSKSWLHSVHRRRIAGGPAAGAISPYGYGGPLCNTTDEGFVSRAWTAWRAGAQAAGMVAELCRFHPGTPHHQFFGGEVQVNRETVSVDLTLAAIDSQFNTLARRKVRRCADVPVRWSRNAADWARFGTFYRAAMATMGAQERYHFSDDYFAAMAALDGIELCICGDGGAWLSAGIYLFQQEGGGMLEYHLGASSEAGHLQGTAYLMQHAAATEGRRRGLGSLYLGGGTTPAGDNPLLFYKRCFSRRMHPYRIGLAVHDRPVFEETARAQGYDPAAALPDLLFA
jgi:hypothetical protein